MDAKFLRPLIVSLATYSVLSFLCLEYCSLDIPPTSYSETVFPGVPHSQSHADDSSVAEADVGIYIYIYGNIDLM